MIMAKSKGKAQSNTVLKRVRQVLRPVGQVIKGPYGVAAIASLSFHGVVFALGPSFSGVSIAAFGEGEGGGDGERTVPLVELSASEQNRLPDFSARRSFSGRVPVPSAPPSSLSIQRTPQRSRASIRPQRSTGLQRTTPNRTRPSVSGVSPRTSVNPPAGTPYVWNGSTRISRIPLPGNIAGQGLPPLPDEDPSAKRPQRDPASETPSTPTTGPDPAANEQPDSPDSSQTPAGAQDLDLAGLQNPQGVGSDSEQPANSEVPAEPSEGTPPEEDPNVAANDPDPEQIRLQQLRDSLVWDGTGTEGGDTAASDWLAQLQAEDETVVAAEVAQNIDSNIRVCVDNPPANGVVGIVVKPDGTISEPTLLQRTGYATTDQAALNAAVAAVSATETPVAYRVNVAVGYDNSSCINPDTMRP